MPDAPTSADMLGRLQLRKTRFQFTTGPNGRASRYWFGERALMTHAANAMNLMFPGAERFLVRTLRQVEGRVDDPKLRREMRIFSGQELLHGKEHTRFFAVLREQGVDVDTFLQNYEAVVFRMVADRLPVDLRLSAGAALEHYTAMFSTVALSSGIIDAMIDDPTLRDLLSWHSAEEIEHKAVVFDVLQTVAPSYRLRMAGYALTTAVFAASWTTATVLLLAKDDELRSRLLRRGRGAAKPHFSLSKMAKIAADVARDFVEYLRPDFHPWQADTYELARPVLERFSVEGASSPSTSPIQQPAWA